MQKYLEYTDFNGTGLVPIMSAVSTAVPLFWSLLLFVFWIAINGASYFAILKLTGKKRFFHTIVATSFVIFLGSIMISSMNTASIIFLRGYWVAFYLLMTVIGWFLLHHYK
jgi:hypothetical protein